MATREETAYYERTHQAGKTMSLLTPFWTALIFVVGLIITNIIANAWRRRGWLFEQKMNYVKERYNRRVQINSQISTLIDSRILHSRNYASIIMENDIEKIQEERKIYRSSVNEWHSKIHSLIVEMKSVFDPMTAYEFDRYFPVEFSSIDQKLSRARKDVEKGGNLYKAYISDAENLLYLLNARAREFSTGLQRTSDRDKKYIEQEPEIEIRNIENLSHTYLFKALFEPRSNT